MKRLLLLLLLSLGLASISYGDHDLVEIAEAEAKAEAIRDAEQKVADEGRRIAEAKMNAPAPAPAPAPGAPSAPPPPPPPSPDSDDEAPPPPPSPDSGKTPADIRAEEERIAYENSEAGREAKRIADEANLQSAAEAKRVAEGLVPDAGKTPADIRAEEERIAYENSEAGREAKRIADEANLQSAAEANDDLCGLEESTSTPEYISDEVNISCSDDVEITEAPTPRPDMFSVAAVEYATAITARAEAGYAPVVAGAPSP